MINSATKISLIGMPSSGKSTIAKIVASKLGFKHVDLDYMVEEREGMNLIEIMQSKGAQYFRDIEYGFLQSIPLDENVVISTPGSSIYHEPMMKWLKDNTKIFYIDEELKNIQERLKHTPKAISDLKEKGLHKLFEERVPVYRRWADFIIEVKGRDMEVLADEIVHNIRNIS